MVSTDWAVRDTYALVGEYSEHSDDSKKMRIGAICAFTNAGSKKLSRLDTYVPFKTMVLSRLKNITGTLV